MAKDLAIVLNNGSLNSAVATALAAQKHRPILVHVDKGGSSSSGEENNLPRRFRTAGGAIQPYREHSIDLPYLSALKVSVAQKLPDIGSAAAAADRDGIAGHELLPIMAAAARFAANYQAPAIYFGLRVGPPSMNWPRPPNTCNLDGDASVALWTAGT